MKTDGSTKETRKLAAAQTIKDWVFNNKVILLFIALCAACILIADTQMSYVLGEVATRFGRNTCLVLALIIPCLAGLGMNFGIVVGAMAAQIAIFWTVHWGLTGIGGFLISTLLCTPMALLFGWLLGKLYNNTKGAEMIAGLVLGFFADGLYRLFVLYIIGGVIPFDDPNLLDRGFGLRNAFDLTGNIKYALDDLSFLTLIQAVLIVLILSELVNLLYKKKRGIAHNAKASLIKCVVMAALLAVSFVLNAIPAAHDLLGVSRLLGLQIVQIGGTAALVYLGIRTVLRLRKGDKSNLVRSIVFAALLVIAIGCSFIPDVEFVLKAIRIPSFTYGVIALFCIFNKWILSTKLGQDMRTVGQSRAVATSAGIDVNRTRIVATCISTVLAAWGQLIFLQNLGTFNTVQQQSNVGLYAVAAILVGGANIQKANNAQAITGVLLFHTLFVVAPLAATKLVGDAAISEYIRMFISYGVIAVSLAMHAWKKHAKPVALSADAVVKTETKGA